MPINLFSMGATKQTIYADQNYQLCPGTVSALPQWARGMSKEERQKLIHQLWVIHIHTTVYILQNYFLWQFINHHPPL
jgi:hypothetical protein